MVIIKHPREHVWKGHNNLGEFSRFHVVTTLTMDAIVVYHGVCKILYTHLIGPVTISLLYIFAYIFRQYIRMGVRYKLFTSHAVVSYHRVKTIMLLIK